MGRVGRTEAAGRGTAAEIRLVRPEEHRELRDLRLAALQYTSELSTHLEREAAAPDEVWVERAARGSAADSMATFVAVRGGDFVGIADGFVAQSGSSVDIGGMWVAPAGRRCGIGRALLEALCEWARGRGARMIRLHVRRANAEALRLYERAGFELEDRTSTSSGATAVRMTKRL